MPFHKIKINIYSSHMFILFVFLFKLFSYVRSAKILVTTIAVNIEDITPIDNVTAIVVTRILADLTYENNLNKKTNKINI